MDDVFRIYSYIEHRDRFGVDGYPLAWHSTVKHAARERDGHRCLRCLHPYEKGAGEWSPCSPECLHVAPDGGPVRIRSVNEDGLPTTMVGADGSTYLAGFVRASFKPEEVAVEAAWRILTVHHLNGVKADCRWWNLVSLCQRCHLTIQGKVKLERAYHRPHSVWFRPFAAGWYAHRYLNEDLTYEETIARLPELLAIELTEAPLF